MKTMICKAVIVLFLLQSHLYAQQFSNSPDSVVFHTEDIHRFWSVFDKTSPRFDARVFDAEYIKPGTLGLQGFLKDRIENGKHLSKTIHDNLTYYQLIRESSLAIDAKKERFYACFHAFREIYPKAIFPDVYFVIGARNSGGTAFGGGLIIGAEMYGKASGDFKPILDIEYVDEVIVHELVHFQQHYASSRTLLAQCIREGAADFICERVAGAHSNAWIHEYGNAHEKELWNEFYANRHSSNFVNWLYYNKDKSRPRDLGYWIGYKITKAYYDKAEDKTKAIDDILNIADFDAFLEKSGYLGK